jgi:hypothetical protein
MKNTKLKYMTFKFKNTLNATRHKIHIYIHPIFKGQKAHKLESTPSVDQ